MKYVLKVRKGTESLSQMLGIKVWIHGTVAAHLVDANQVLSCYLTSISLEKRQQNFQFPHLP
jgi:hypothetical protein